MFGYVRPRQDLLSEANRALYEEVYCGLCHTMGEGYGLFSRMFLNYDFAFLAMLLAPMGAHTPALCRTCPRHPIRGKEGCEGGDWLELCAGESVILTRWKLADTVADGGFWTGLGARAAGALLGRGYRRARAKLPDFDTATAALLGELSALEREGCPSIDRTADCFARLLRGAAPVTGEEGVDRPRAELLYHLGRWIYLVDGVDDREEDSRTGNYNPVAARFPDWSEEDRAYLRANLERSLERMGAAFQLLAPNPYTPVLENILYAGLPNVTELVFAGKWREAQREKKGGRTP